MKINPVVNEVRRARKQISLRYENNLKKLVSHYQQEERNLVCRVRESRTLRRAV